MNKRWNEDVPAEAILRQVLIENGKLKSEIDELKDTLARRDAAIAAFKKWQGKMATYKWQYWFHEGLKLADEKPDDSVLVKMRSLFTLSDYYNRQVKRFESAYERLCEQQEIVQQLNYNENDDERGLHEAEQGETC